MQRGEEVFLERKTDIWTPEFTGGKRTKHEVFMEECRRLSHGRLAQTIPHLCLLGPATVKAHEAADEYARIIIDSNLFPTHITPQYLKKQIRSDASKQEIVSLFQDMDDSQRGPYFCGCCFFELTHNVRYRDQEAVEETLQMLLDYLTENHDHMRAVILLPEVEMKNKLIRNACVGIRCLSIEKQSVMEKADYIFSELREKYGVRGKQQLLRENIEDLVVSYENTVALQQYDLSLIAQQVSFLLHEGKDKMDNSFREWIKRNEENTTKSVRIGF